MWDGKEVFIAIGQILLAAYGSLVRWLNIKDRRRQTIYLLVGDMSAAVLSGIIVYFLFYRFWGLDVFLCFCIAPALGLLGYKALERLEPVIFKNTGLEKLTKKEDESK